MTMKIHFKVTYRMLDYIYRNGEASASQLMSTARVNYDTFKRTRNVLLEHGLINETKRRGRGRHGFSLVYTLTEKGMRFVKHARQLLMLFNEADENMPAIVGDAENVIV